MEYVRTESGFEKLTQQNVDFGGGLERIVAATRNDADVFNIDVFDIPKQTIKKLSGKTYEGEHVYAYRVILDHLRAATFLVGDGVLPGNKDQMYFVRRLIRRAVRFARTLGIQENFTKEVVASYIEVYSGEYTNLLEKKEAILSAIDTEESKFRKTLENGIKEFERISKRDHFNIQNRQINNENKRIFGHEAFNLLQSYGFPIELTQELAKEKGWEVDLEDFEILKKEHAESSRTASAGKFKGGLGGDGEMETKYHTATHMLHQALKIVLGENVQQKGSNITSERLRFDFAYDRKMTDEEKKQVEDIVNEHIKKDLPMVREEIRYEEAVARGAIGLFGDKYGDTVSIYYMGSSGNKRGDDGLFSIEFCGGPHVEHTGVLGTFRISKEEAVSAGVRRIKAVLE
jgi:alanyl-tRNA synthetase